MLALAGHSLSVASGLETTRRPSGLKATLVTASVCPVSGIPIEVPVSAFHSRTVLSSPPETIAWPSGLMAMLLTASVCR